MDIADPELWRRTTDQLSVDPKSWRTVGPCGGQATRLEPPPVLLLRAGASTPSLPVAAELKRELLRLVVQIADTGFEDFDSLLARISQPHITLEVFFSMLGYRCGSAFRPIELWNGLCRDIPVNRLSRSIALLRQAGLIGTILTTNFDEMLPRALESVGVKEGRDFRIITEWQMEKPTAAEPTMNWVRSARSI